MISYLSEASSLQIFVVYSLTGVVACEQDFDIFVRRFKMYSWYYVPFLTSNLGIGKNPITFLPAYRDFSSTMLVLA